MATNKLYLQTYDNGAIKVGVQYDSATLVVSRIGLVATPLASRSVTIVFNGVTFTVSPKTSLWRNISALGIRMVRTLEENPDNLTGAQIEPTLPALMSLSVSTRLISNG